MQWPPIFKIRKHHLAKSVKLKITPFEGLIVTTPVRFNLKKLPTILESNKTWILKHLSFDVVNDFLPHSIEFHATAETWLIKKNIYPSHRNHTFSYDEKNKVLYLNDLKVTDTSMSSIIKWVKKYATSHLTGLFYEVSNAVRISCQRLTIREQKTKWGSCSNQHAININYRLIFLPRNLVQHVMIHELCHTIHFDHSKAFWGLVAEHDPHWRLHRRELKRAQIYIPSLFKA